MIDTHRRVGKHRAEREREVVTDAVDTLIGLLETHDIDRERYDEQATRKLNGLPERYRTEFRGMVDALPVSAADLSLYAFAIGDLTDAIADDAVATDAADSPPEGCTNLVVAGERTAHGDPLVLKNRDVSGGGLRPQSVVNYAGDEDHHSFATISTCGSVLVFQGVNDAGLVAANTFVDVDTDTATEEEVLNGVLIRRVLEACETVAEARAFVTDRRLDRVQGLTLALADETDAALLEVDPVAREVRAVSGPIMARTNHYTGTIQPDESEATTRREGPDETASTAVRFARARELAADLSDDVDREELFAVAEDHRNGPGPDSICRHAGENPGPYRVGQSTTVSTTVYRGGDTTFRGVVGAPCESSPVEIPLGGSVSDDLRTGRYWRETVGELR